MSVEVKPGEIRVNSILTLRDTKDMKLFTVDCLSKYPEAYMSSVMGGGREFIEHWLHLVANEHTLRTHPERDWPTDIKLFDTDGDFWHVSVSGNRYSVYVSAIRMPKRITGECVTVDEPGEFS